LSALSAGHLDGDGRAEVVFGALNSAADYDPETGSCANLYCHGNGHGRLGGVVWTSTEPVDCSSCHPYRGSTADEFRAMSGQHLLHAQSSGFLCSVCHATTVNEAGVITGRSTHVDGGPDVEFDTAAAGAMRRSGGRCFGGCHFHPHVGAAW
jgi:predicted CxxxxCH...CXXCH cytochrome family protein